MKRCDYNSNEGKSILTQAILQYLGNRLEDLQSDKLDSEKTFWKEVGDELKGKKIITEDQKNEFCNKLNDVYNVNGFVSALQWLGCVLLVPITFGLALKSDKIRNRISHPTDRRVFERFKERKNELFSPLKMVANANRENNDMNR